MTWVYDAGLFAVGAFLLIACLATLVGGFRR